MTKKGCCQDEEFVRKIKDKIESDEIIYDLADFFKLFGDSTRVKILSALFNGEMCVGTITEVLDMTQSAVSHQLRILKSGRLVKSRKEGKWVYYSLNDEHVAMIYRMGLEHIFE